MITYGKKLRSGNSISMSKQLEKITKNYKSLRKLQKKKNNNKKLHVHPYKNYRKLQLSWNTKVNVGCLLEIKCLDVWP